MNKHLTILKNAFLKKKYAAIVSIIGLLAFFLLFFNNYLINTHQKNLEESINIRSNFMLHIISMESNLDILLLDTIALEKKIKNYLTRNPDISGISFFQGNGKIITGTLPIITKKGMQKNYHKKVGDQLISTIKVLNNNGDNLGFISISYGSSTLNQMTKNLTNKLIVMTILLLFIVSFILIKLMRIISFSTTREAQNLAKLELIKKKAEIQKSFLANMSHELRTPLNGIMGFTKLLLNNITKKENLTHLNYVMDSSQSMLTLINDILDFSKIESGEMVLEDEDFDINALVINICKFLAPKIPNSIYFNHDSLPKEKLYVYGDKQRTRQVLINIINNAIKYTEKGSITIKSESYLKNKIILFRCSIKDTGIGINEKSKKNIFTAFKQVHKKEELTKDIVGTGLGLSISKTIVEKMNGKIWFKSKKGKGSTFYFEIYLKEGNKKNIKNNSFTPQKLNYQTNAHIIIAEDNHINQLLIEKSIEKIGITFDFANNGQEVIDLLKGDRKYDLILMDLQMPVMGGIEATKKIRQSNWKHNKIPIIALTANAIKGDKEFCLKSGMNGYVSKPIDDSTLIEELKQHISFTIISKKNTHSQRVNKPVNTIKHINKKKMLDFFNNDDSKLKELLKIFTETIELDLEKMLQMQKENKRKELSRIAHKLKPTVSFIGDEEDFERIKTIEISACSTEELNVTVSEFINTMTLYQTEASNFINQ